MPDCYFDDSLPWLIETLATEVGDDVLATGVVLRDASGRLAFFSGVSLDEAVVGRLLEQLQARLGSYMRPDRALAMPDDVGANRVLTDDRARNVEVAAHAVRYLDRRIVGVDWMRSPESRVPNPPRIAFASLKGGVGRSTAISVVAAEEARRGRNVLVLDLDLEAPGIGSMLLADDRVPTYGVLDYLVEQNLDPVKASALDAFVGASGLTQGKGLVDVVPVAGTRSSGTPSNYMAKLSRAMLEGGSRNGRLLSVGDKIGTMIDTFTGRRPYDLVLVDVRAGLAELAAGPILGLGATVLLFGTAQRQTIEGFRYLFAHIQSLVKDGDGPPWNSIRMVHAKAQSGAVHAVFRDQLWELFSDYLYESEESAALESFSYGATAPDAPHNPIPIPLDPAFADWSPIDAPDTLLDSYYARTFGALLAFVNETRATAVSP